MRSSSADPPDTASRAPVDALADDPFDAPWGAFPLSRRARAAWWAATLPWPSRLKRRIRRRVRGIEGPFDVAVPLEGVPLEGVPSEERGATERSIRMRLWPARNYCDRIVVGQNRLPEPNEHRALLPLVRPGIRFVDIGANVGAYTLFVGARARMKGRGLEEEAARILAFEPHPDTARKLRLNCRLNGLDVHVRECAVGEAPGELDLWSDGGGNVGQTSLLAEATSNAKLRHAVAVETLAGALDEAGFDRIDLLKIDVEGWEDRALGPYLDRPTVGLPGAILLEAEHAALWRRDLRAELLALGYRETFRTEQNRLYVLS